MSNVYIIGVGMTRFGKFPDRSVKDLTRQAVEAALDDCGLARKDVEAAYFANAAQAAVEGQYLVPGQIALRAAGFEGIPVTNVENACASASTALNAACAYIGSGQGDIVLAIGADKMNAEERARSFAVFDGAWDVHEAERAAAQLLSMGQDLPRPPGAGRNSGQRSVFMDIYAALARHHMETFGLTQTEIAIASAKNHTNSQHNPNAQYQRPMSVEEVLADREVAWPLTLAMCAPISDGAAVAIVCSERKARELGLGRAVRVAASVLRSGSGRGPDEFDRQVTHLAANSAYEKAGLGPEDMDVAEVHDASAFAEILQTEALGFCAFGDGGRCAADGDTAIGGRIPINPSGGLESRGHPIGATGLAQVHELVTQLRGEAGARQVDNARVAIAENGGGFAGYEEAAACITILQRA
ncbi:thiolase family protein [Oceanibacterium hippocampi]|uniref:3-ketoacyl-CoA thiolase n=1 Tax=Oceanibacterium hippocampi TaxID=745714 RepID=A0A1Y5RTH3_9PROT|nr:thiolase family protein [Oceanibacterium hippocampi]SLN23871.1 3-ketoacyl-CoA thiolase [Oceanibacterium hippocampi]